MRVTRAIGIVCASLCFIAQGFIERCYAGETTQVPAVQVTPEKAAQPATDDDQDPRDNRKTPLTPEEERERQIRLFDPLDRSLDNRTSARPAAQPAHQGPGNVDRTNPGETTHSDSQPLPGSIAADQSAGGAGSGPRVAGDESGSQSGEYTGPAVLSRSYSINTLAVPTDLKWHESVSYSEIYDSGTTREVPGATGPAPGGSSGASLGWTFSGGRLIHRDQFGFVYSGSMSVYAGNGSLNGTNQQLSMNYSHLFTRRLSLVMTNSGSLLSSNYALQNPIPTSGTSIANVNLGSSPSVQPTDTSTKQFSSQVSLNWQETARLSYNMSMGYFAIVRGSGLIGSTGTQAQGTVNYRFSPRTTVGLYYSYGRNQYAQGLGVSDSSSGGLSYSFALNKSTQLRIRAGLSSTETIAETLVPLPPLVAFLLGTTTGIADVYRKASSSDLSGQLVKDFGRSLTGSLAYAKGVSPGNGILLTSTEQTLSATMSAQLKRVYKVQFGFVNQSLTAIGQTLAASFNSDAVQVSVSRNYRSGLALNFSAAYTYFGSHNPNLVPYQTHISSGISWTPVGLKVWPF
jgi:hypothetical protein